MTPDMRRITAMDKAEIRRIADYIKDQDLDLKRGFTSGIIEG